MLNWQKNFLDRFGEQPATEKKSKFEEDVQSFAEKMANLATGGSADTIRRMRLREPCLPCMKNRS